MTKFIEYLKNFRASNNKIFIYVAYISFASVFTAELNIIHTHFLLGVELSPLSFIAPTIAGILFGYLLAHIQLLREQLREVAYTDSLTGIYNRLHFNRLLDAEMEKIKRYGGELSIIFFDIDNFKQINDTYGHPTGDAILKKIAEVIASANRSTDVFARYGGEEFIIMAVSTNIHGAKEHAQRLRRDIEQHRFEIGHVTASFGVAECEIASDDRLTLLQRADKALYQAKAEGRNCVRQL